MYLGLDLRGGAHFLFEVDMDEAIKSAETKYVSDWKRETRTQKVRGYRVEHRDGSIVARYNKAEDRDRMLELFLREGRDLNFDTSEDEKYFYVTANLTEEAIVTEKSAVLQQNISTLRSRVNELGVSEPVIQQQGLDRIVVQLPGIQDPERAKRILGATATLEYRLVYGSYADWQSAATGSIPPGARLYKQREDGSPILLSSDIIVTGDQIKDAASGFSQDNGSPSVSVTLDGADNIRQGFMSAVVGLALVVAFMAFYYRVFGLVAGMALVVNVVLIVAVLSALQATLTLPGIAGIVLTTGMAVDANVLIFERIREEIRSGSSIQSAISSGYDKAFVTIADANVTTLIAAIVLFSMGTGAIKGFAITLCIGILTSMFTAIFASRVLINAIYGGKRVKALAI